jgi:drug/metabolite transporter (DMT)-like permease
MRVRAARAYPHGVAVGVLASTGVFLGAGFAALQIALRAGLSVGAVLSLRFLAAATGMGVLCWMRREPLTRRAMRDGSCLGLLLVTIFWLQADGLRFTTTSKSGFITSLYVPLTPLLAIVVGERVRPGHALAAILATCGLVMLVQIPGGLQSGWNRGDIETVLCAVLCAGHLIATTHFSRASSGWALAWVQILITGIVSAVATLLLPAPNGFQGVIAALRNRAALAALAYMVTFNTMYAFWGLCTMQAFLSSTEAAVVFCLEPLTAGLVAVYLVAETLTRVQVGGAALIIIAMIASEALPRMRSHAGSAI